MPLKLERCVPAAGLAVIGALQLSCSQTPTTPSMPVASGQLAISNLQVKEIGVGHVFCHLSQFDYSVIDVVSFEVNRADEAGLIGATINQQDAGKPPVPIATISACHATASPCAGVFNACLLPSSSPTTATVQGFPVAGWTPQKTWNISLTAAGVQSNTLSAQITRPNELPWGDVATIVSFSLERTSARSGTQTFLAFSPGVPGRRIAFTEDVFSGSTLIVSLPFPPAAEAAGRNTEGGFGGILLPLGEALVVLTMEERDAAGNVLAREVQTRVVK